MFDYYQHIESFLLDKLSPEDRATFVTEMNKNPELRHMVDNSPVYKDISDALITDLIDKNIRSVKSEISRSRKVKLISWASGIAASVLIIGGVSMLTIFQNDHNNDEIFDKYFSPPMGTVSRNSSIEELSMMKPCDAGHVLLDRSQYLLALKQFEESLSDNDLRCSEKSEFYKMLTLIKQNRINDAKIILNSILNNQNHSFFIKSKSIMKDLGN